MSDEPNWAEIARQLQAPFDPADVKQKKGRGGKQLDYIDARAVAARLDAVVGPGNWSFNWEPMVIQRPERGVVWENGERKPAPEPEVDAVCVAKGILTIYGVSKADIGYAGAIEPNKASISNALRRCAALWGIGRYLYNQEQTRQNDSGRPQTQRAAQSPAAAPKPATAPVQESAGTHPPPADLTDKAMATDQQIFAIRGLTPKAGMTPDALLASLNVQALTALTHERARKLIDRLTALAKERGAA